MGGKIQPEERDQSTPASTRSPTPPMIHSTMLRVGAPSVREGSIADRRSRSRIPLSRGSPQTSRYQPAPRRSLPSLPARKTNGISVKMSPRRTTMTMVLVSIEPPDLKSAEYYACQRYGDDRSVSIANRLMASETASGFTSPISARVESTATTMCSVSISKNRRSASRVSDRPNPSVPSETYGWWTHRAIWSGTDFMESLTAITGPSWPLSVRTTYGSRVGLPGWRRFQRSHSRASLRSCWYDVALHTLADTSYSWARISWARRAWVTRGPDARIWALCPRSPFGPSLNW